MTFSRLASLAVLKLRRECDDFRELKLRLVLPCPPSLQSRRWKSADRAAYLPIYDEADSVEITGTTCDGTAMFARNNRLVALGGCGICYLAREKAGSKSGGTVYTVKRAKQRGVAVCNIAEILDGNVTQTLPFIDDRDYKLPFTDGGDSFNADFSRYDHLQKLRYRGNIITKKLTITHTKCDGKP